MTVFYTVMFLQILKFDLLWFFRKQKEDTQAWLPEGDNDYMRAHEVPFTVFCL